MFNERRIESEEELPKHNKDLPNSDLHEDDFSLRGGVEAGDIRAEGEDLNPDQIMADAERLATELREVGGQGGEGSSFKKNMGAVEILQGEQRSKPKLAKKGGGLFKKIGGSILATAFLAGVVGNTEAQGNKNQQGQKQEGPKTKQELRSGLAQQISERTRLYINLNEAIFNGRKEINAMQKELGRLRSLCSATTVALAIGDSARGLPTRSEESGKEKQDRLNVEEKIKSTRSQIDDLTATLNRRSFGITLELQNMTTQIRTLEISIVNTQSKLRGR